MADTPSKPRRRWSYSLLVYALAPAFIALVMLADGAGFSTNPRAALLWAMCLLALQAVLVARWMQLQGRRIDRLEEKTGDDSRR